jgi:hypothetical protein
LILTCESERTTRILFVCCIIQIAGCIYYWSSFTQNGYLPSPFVWDKADTFMDFFHSMYWADEPGRYIDWGSVYPPLNFVFLKAARWLLFGQIHESDPFILRESAKHVVPAIVVAFAASAAFVFRHDLWCGFTGAQKALFFFIFFLSPPMLFSIERGNLIIFALGFLALALAKPGRSRTLAIGILINIKPYFALYLVAFLVSQRPKEFVSCTMMAGAIFLLSGIVLDQHFLEFLRNLLQFSSDDNLFSPRELLGLPSSISAFTSVLRIYLSVGGDLSIAGVPSDWIIVLVESVKWLAIIAAFVSLGLGRCRIPVETTLVVTTIAITNLGVSVGGYSLILYICLLPVLFRLKYRNIYLACIFLIFMPTDVITLYSDEVGNRYAYLSDTISPIVWQLSLGAILRPVVNFGLLLVISIEIFGNYTPWQLFLKRFHATVGKRTLPGQFAAYLEHRAMRPA